MHSQLGYTLTAWRWTIAVASLVLGSSMLRDPEADPWVALLFLVLGTAMMGLEFYLRRTRKTLVLTQGTITVHQRKISLGSIPAPLVRYWDRSSRVRVLIKAQLVSFVCFFVFGSLIFFSGDRPLGLALLLTGVIFSTAAIWEFRTLWQIVLPASRPGDSSVGVQPSRDSTSGALPLPSKQMVVLLRKADVMTLLGFWPADSKGSGHR